MDPRWSSAPDNVLPRVQRSRCWSGYYFERMMQQPRPDGTSFNQLWDIVERLRDPAVRALNKFEPSIFDPVRDVGAAGALVPLLAGLIGGSWVLSRPAD